mmetsp:Transcript_17904/g.27684  ORF Transcript_17904/g.27684 Transcript_17904/m.27684 type:complete len:432 (+) Transcript_17904:49-1344(+)
MVYGKWVEANPRCIELHDHSDYVYVFQLCFAVVCACQVIFMFTRAPNVGWEAIYLPLAEVVTYSIAANGEGVLRMADGRYFNFAKLAGWAVCCPIMLIQIGGMAQIKYRTIPLNNVVLAASLNRIIFGMASAITASDPARWGFYFCAWICYLTEVGITLTIMAVAISDFSKIKTELGQWVVGRIQTMRIIFLVAWTSFPVVWVLGYTGFCVIHEDYIALLYLFADLLSKNTWGVMMWHTTWVKLNGKWDREFAAAGGHEALKKALEQDVEIGAGEKNQNQLTARQQEELDIKVMGVKIPSITRRRRFEDEGAEAGRGRSPYSRYDYPMRPRDSSEYLEGRHSLSMNEDSERSEILRALAVLTRQDKELASIPRIAELMEEKRESDRAETLKALDTLQKKDQELASISKIAELISSMQQGREARDPAPEGRV